MMVYLVTRPYRAIIVAALFAIGCSSTIDEEPPGQGRRPRPAWIDTRTHPEYPDALFLIGVGGAAGSLQSKAMEDARVAAGADILAELQTHIESAVTNYVRETLIRENEREKRFSLASGTIQAKATTAGTLKFAKPVDRYYDRDTGEAWVLVAIHRGDYAADIQNELERIAARIRTLHAEAEASAQGNKPYQAFRRYRQVEQLLLQEAALRANLTYVSGQPSRIDPTLSFADVFSQRRTQAGKFTVSLLVRHTAFDQPVSAASLENLLLEPLRELGIPVEAVKQERLGQWPADSFNDPAFLRKNFGSGSGQRLLLVGDFVTTSLPTAAGLIGVRCSASLRLLEVETGALLLSDSSSSDGEGGGPVVGLEAKRFQYAEEAAEKIARFLSQRLAEQI